MANHSQSRNGQTGGPRMQGGVAKLALNVALSSNVCALSAADRADLVRCAGIGPTFWISPQAVHGRTKIPVRWFQTADSRRRCRFNLIYFGIQSGAFEDDARDEFLRSLIQPGGNYLETELGAAVAKGENLLGREQGQGGIRKKLVTSMTEFDAYRDSCLKLIESIRTNGVLDCAQPTPDFRPSGPIQVAIGGQGEFLLHRKGRHRFLIAKHLGIDRVPVVARCISGAYFRRFVSRRDLTSPERFLAAIGAGVGEAKRRHGAATAKQERRAA